MIYSVECYSCEFNRRARWWFVKKDSAIHRLREWVRHHKIADASVYRHILPPQPNKLSGQVQLVACLQALECPPELLGYEKGTEHAIAKLEEGKE